MSGRHIAIIVHDFSTGGSERIAIRLANAWVQQGRRVSIFCGTEQGAARTLVDEGVSVFQAIPETVRTPLSRVRLSWRFANLVRQHQPDVVFSPGNFHLIMLALMARMRFEQRPVFLSKISNPIRRDGFRQRVEGLADWLIARVAQPVDCLIAMSSALGDEARAVFAPAKIVEIDEPVLTDEAGPPQRFSKSKRQKVILCIGRLSPQKDFMTALQTFALLRPTHGVRLRILGEGPLRGQLEAEVARLGIGDRVEMPGYSSDISGQLAQADLLLMTSKYEGYPAVLVEAIAAGLPIVTTNCTLAIQEIISSPVIGQVVESRSPRALADAVEAQLMHPRPDPEFVALATKRHRIGPSSRAYLALFDRLAAARVAGTQPALDVRQQMPPAN